MVTATNRVRNSVLSLLSATVIAAGVVAPVASAQQSPTGTGESITWEECPPQVDIPTAQCGRIEVPMHYSDPAAGEISVGFVQIPARDQAARRGVIFGNAGGPGGDAYSFFGNTAMEWPAELYNEWDLVAVQPRGLIGSTPVDCSTPAPGYDELRMITQAGAFVRDSCELGTPGYTSSLTTDNTANDWEMVRRALGEEKISILGLSYGTYLGAVYATRYPAHTDRVVLDSAMAPGLSWNGVMAAQEQGYINALHDFFTWAADHHEVYGLGETPLAVYQAWSNRIVAESGTNPTVAPPPARIGDIPPAFASSGQMGADVVTAVAPTGVALQGLATQLLNPGANQAMSPLLIITQATIPQPSTWPNLARAVSGEEPVPDLAQLSADEQTQLVMSNAVNMQRLVMCNENSVAPNPLEIPRAAWTGLVTGDIFSATSTYFSSGMACSGLTPTSGVQPLDGSQLEVRPLLIQGTRDPQTPYHLHGELAQAMGAHVLTVDGPGHGQAVGTQNPAVSGAMIGYLRSGNPGVTSLPGYLPTP